MRYRTGKACTTADEERCGRCMWTGAGDMFSKIIPKVTKTEV
jgi:hypothetical protein